MIKIDPELKALIPPLAPEEYAQLEANLIADGCRDPLVVWGVPPDDWWTAEGILLTNELVSDEDILTRKSCANRSVEILNRTPQFVYLRVTDREDGVSSECWEFGVVAKDPLSPYETSSDAGEGSFILIDGHNRREICAKHNIPFQVVPKFFDDRSHAKEWIIRNQFGRRNLLPYIRTKLALELEETIAARSEQGKRTDLFPKSEKSQPLNATKEIASIAGVGHDTVAKVKKIEAKATPDVKAKLARGEMSINEAHWAVRSQEKAEKHQEQVKEMKKKITTEKTLSVDFFNQDWREGLAKIEDGSIALLLTDPPYGMSYVSNFRTEKHRAIEGDEDCRAFEDLVSCVGPKLKADAHILAFVNWRNEAAFIALLEGAGFAVKSSIVWVKNNTGMGDLNGAFAPKHERILHAVKGKPRLYFREADVICADRVATDNHPTEKPVDLLEKLINATTQEGELVCDPFAGVASTLVAAKARGRRFVGFEIDADYHAVGYGRLK